MKKLAIVKYPEKILKRKAGAITPTAEIQQLIPSMITAMYENDGIGLAAPQIGISKQIIIVETSRSPREHKDLPAGRHGEHHHSAPGLSANETGKPLAFLNPRISSKSKEAEIEEEGCLSLPGIFVPVRRSESIKVTCQTPEGEHIQLKASGLIARIFQHEVDHLKGKLIIDRLSPLKRLKLRPQLRELANHKK